MARMSTPCVKGKSQRRDSIVIVPPENEANAVTRIAIHRLFVLS